MAWNEVKLERVYYGEDILTISKNGIFFNAQFVKKNIPDHLKGVKILSDDTNQYKFGFKFVPENGSHSNTLSLLRRKKLNGASVSSTQLLYKFPILKAYTKYESRSERRVHIHKDERLDNCFYINLTPSFEHTIKFEDLSQIPSGTSGIYRYLSNNSEIIYIGKGNIKDRAKAADRVEWNIKTIQYSIIESDDDAYYWENYHLEEFIKKNGGKPPFNINNGRQSVESNLHIPKTNDRQGEVM